MCKTNHVFKKSYYTIRYLKLTEFHVIIQAVTCAPLNTPPRALLLTVSCGSTYASTCVYGCQSGYGSTDPNATRTCLQTGRWSGKPINCTGINALVRLVCCMLYWEQDGYSWLFWQWNIPHAKLSEKRVKFNCPKLTPWQTRWQKKTRCNEIQTVQV